MDLELDLDDSTRHRVEAETSGGGQADALEATGQRRELDLLESDVPRSVLAGDRFLRRQRCRVEVTPATASSAAAQPTQRWRPL